jgi:C4-dicarboxylate-specific signal transduction histidine kinase
MRELTRKSEKQLEPVDINIVLKECLDFLHPQIRLAGITVFCKLGPNLPKVMGYRVRLSQVFLNILANAKQAMEEKNERKLTIHSAYENNSVKVYISDTGKGFKPEDKEKLFHPFFTTKKSGQGTGLGLSISMSIINDHNGKIYANGKEGQGAAFEIQLPIGAKNVLNRNG